MSVKKEEKDEMKTESTVAQVSEFSTDLLRLYYDRLFPYDAMFNWLAYGNDPSKPDVVDKNQFRNREWSFTIEDDIYIRYQSFNNKQEMIDAIKKRQPHKIDIGAVFSGFPKDHATIKPELFKPVERELVFDVDMTDYDDVRTCCTGANICPRCWSYMTMAIKTIDGALREDFAFKNILWVYSGRRGVHCWVCDPAARALSNEARTAVVDYLSIHMGSKENSDKRLQRAFQHPMHPMVKRAYALLEPYFAENIANKGDIVGQGLLASRNSFTKLLNTLPNDSIREELHTLWVKNPEVPGKTRWEQLVAKTTDGQSNESAESRKRKKINYVELEAWRYELVLTHTYARLDINVSKTQNHLLKSPFCIHPKTGRVCVPINPKECDDFDPFTVPTLRSLVDELDAYTGPPKDDMMKTSMEGVMKTWEDCFYTGLVATIRKELRDAEDRKSASIMDF